MCFSLLSEETSQSLKQNVDLFSKIKTNKHVNELKVLLVVSFRFFECFFDQILNSLLSLLRIFTQWSRWLDEIFLLQTFINRLEKKQS